MSLGFHISQTDVHYVAEIAKMSKNINKHTLVKRILKFCNKCTTLQELPVIKNNKKKSHHGLHVIFIF